MGCGSIPGTDFSIISTPAPSQPAEAWGRALPGSGEVFWEVQRAGNVSDPPLHRAVTHVRAELPELQQRLPKGCPLPAGICLGALCPSAGTESPLKSENVQEKAEKTGGGGRKRVEEYVG